MYQNLRALLTKRFHIPKERTIERALRRLTLAEKAVFYFLAGLFVFSGLALLYKVNGSFLTSVPLQGGTVTEGVIGNPRFINPVLAISEADKNLVSLIYSSLVKIDSDGKPQNDLAESIDISSDGLTYTVALKSGAFFQDGEPLTADDVVFTIQKILDPSLKSPLFGDFAGVNVRKIDDKTIAFTLKKPYAPFIENLSVGILPKHIWSGVTDDEFYFSQWNVLPVGSGPYKVGNVTRDSGGIPNYYDLVPYDKSLSGAPFVGHYVFKFYPSENALVEAYRAGDIDSAAGISPEDALALKKDNGARVLSSPLPRVFGVFFNQNSNKALLDKSVRQALDLAAPKEEIVEKVLDGYGTPINSPLPPSLFPSIQDPETTPLADREKQAADILAKAGWVKNPSTGVLEKKTKTDTLRLSFSISTSDNPELSAAANILKAAWQDLGADVSVSVYDQGDLNQNVIRPRRYEALLFGEVVGREADVYPFWHSSERNDPGLNIALYVNSSVDKLLEDSRKETDPDKREALYKNFDQIVESDVPAVFLYSPSFLYVVPPSVKGIDISLLGSSQDRFRDVANWYIETNSVWNIFTKKS